MGVGILSGTKVIIGDSETKSLLKERGFGGRSLPTTKGPSSAFSLNDPEQERI